MKLLAIIFTRYHLINLALLSTAALCFIFAYADSNIYLLAFAIPVLFYLVFHKRNPSVKARIYYGLFFAIFIAVGGFYWLTHTLLVFGGMPKWASYVVFCLYALAFNLKYPIYFLLLHFFRKMPLAGWFKYSGLFVLCEFFSVELFPYTLGASQYLNLIYIQSADFLGAYGMSFLVFANAFLIYYLFIRTLLAAFLSLKRKTL